MDTVNATPANPHGLTFTAGDFVGNVAAFEGRWPERSVLDSLLAQLTEL
jgi:hypothetical protein